MTKVNSNAVPDIQSIPGSLASIMPAAWNDFRAIQRLERVCFPQDAWPVWDILAVLTLPSVVRLKAVVDGKVVGFVAADVRRKDALAWIATIGVLPSYRRQGIGRALLATCESHLDVTRIRLSVRLSNVGAQTLYRQMGYYRVDLWRAYYKGGEDALVMEKRTAPLQHPLSFG